MILEILISILIGLIAGSITGLFPGIHINLLSAILISSLTLSFFSSITPIFLVVFIVSMAITHTFLDFIPSVYFGAPEEDSFLSVLPGHDLLLKGRGHEAVLLTLLGSLTALPIILLFTPIFAISLKKIFTFIKIAIPFILIFISIYLLLREKEIIISTVVFILSGFLGYATFNLPVKEPLLPLLSGLFGLSALIISLKSSRQIPPQMITPLKKINLSKKQILFTSTSSALSAPLCSFLPGIGSSHAAVIASELDSRNEKDNRNFLLLLGSINTIVMALSFVTIYSIGRTRTGAASAVLEILTEITPFNLAIIISTIIISGICAFFIGISLSKSISKKINKISYKGLSLTIIGLLFLINILISNPLGILVLLTATSLGVYTILSGARRINLMGALLIPSIMFYLF